MEQRAVTTIRTPAALIELKTLVANTQRMAQRAHSLGVSLRPHVKTHKCVEAARYQVAGHFGGITVSTLAEAERFADAGFDDITYAVPLAPGRARRAVALSRAVRALQVLVDHPAAVAALAAEVVAGAPPLRVLVKVDCGYHRAGLLPDDPQLVVLARRIAATPGLCFAGVLVHGGHAYDCVGVEAIKRVARAERAEAVRAAENLRAAGLAVEVVSVGSTPTAAVVEDLTGVTELRPGNYALFDLFQASIGSCAVEDVALTVLTEVIGVYPERSMALVDAGALAMSKDRGAAHVPGVRGYGRVCDLDGMWLKGVSLVGLSQEHGKLHIGADYAGSPLQLGERLRIVPHHSCLVTALHDPLYVLEDGQITAQWRPVRGW